MNKKVVKFLISFVFYFSILFNLHAKSDGLPRGAYKMPYSRYEANTGNFGRGAKIIGPTYDQSNTASEASEKCYVELPSKGAFVEWKINESINGVTIRFTMPDSDDGEGLSGDLNVYVNKKFVQSITFSSHHAWQYFYKQKEQDYHSHHEPSVGNGRMRFDEDRFILSYGLKRGDVLMLEKVESDNIPFGIDFIEVEKIASVIKKPQGFIDVTQSPYNAVADDQKDDFHSFVLAINDACKQKTGLYIPKGKFLLSDQLKLNDNNIIVQGAGIWYTHIHFTAEKEEAGKGGGGIYANGSYLKVSDFYVTSELHNRLDGYQAFGQYWGKNSTIENVWLSHFSSGFWIGDYQTKNNNVADGLVVRNCRIRNTYADGLNFASGSSNCIIEQCNVRNTGDDGMASWSSDTKNVGPNTHNVFRFNTVENVVRAAGVGIYGGQEHEVHHCIFRDNFAGAGIRVTSTFASWPFPEDSFVKIYDNTIIRCGTRYDLWDNRKGAININVRYYDVQNIHFRNIDVFDSQVDGLNVTGEGKKFGVYNVLFENVKFYTTGADKLGDGYGQYISDNVKGWIKNINVETKNLTSAKYYEESPAFEIKEK